MAALTIGLTIGLIIACVVLAILAIMIFTGKGLSYLKISPEKISCTKLPDTVTATGHTGPFWECPK